jgi:hypothetical protein
MLLVSLRPADSRSSGREAVSGNTTAVCSQELQRREPQKKKKKKKKK